jgi:hypothetical protein
VLRFGPSVRGSEKGLAQHRLVSGAALLCAIYLGPIDGNAADRVETDVKELQEYTVFDLPGMEQELHGKLEAIASHPVISVGKVVLTNRCLPDQPCPRDIHYVQDYICFTIHLRDRGLLANRITRLTVVWTAMKGPLPKADWSEQAIGIRAILTKTTNRLMAMDVVRAGQSGSAGRLLSTQISPNSFSANGNLTIRIDRNEHFASRAQNDWISVDAISLEMLR